MCVCVQDHIILQVNLKTGADSAPKTRCSKNAICNAYDNELSRQINELLLVVKTHQHHLPDVMCATIGCLIYR